MVTAAALILLTGCQTYHPVPLTHEAVDSALQPPAPETLEAEAQRLSHPVLRPVKVDLSKGLTPAPAGVLAVLVNPNLKALRDRRAISGAQLLQAQLLPNPQLTLGVDVPTDRNLAGTSMGTAIGLNWDVRDLIDHAAKVAAALNRNHQIELDIAWREWVIAEQAKTAVYKQVAIGRELKLATQAHRRLAKNIDMIRDAVQQQQMPQRNLTIAQTAAQEAEAKVLDLQKQAEQARLEMNHLLGLPADRRVKLAESIALPQHVNPPSAAVLENDIERRRLDLVALRAGYASQEARVRAAILDQFPRINVGINHATDTSDVGTTGIGLAIELPVFDRNQAQIAQARATRQQLFDEYANRVFDARFNIASLLAEIHALNRQVAAAQRLIPNLRDLTRKYQQAANQGQIDVLTYNAIREKLTDKQLEILKLQVQLIANQTALEVATGLYDLSSVTSTTHDVQSHDQHEEGKR